MLIEYISISEDDVYDEVIEFMYELKDSGLYNNQNKCIDTWLKLRAM